MTRFRLSTLLALFALMTAASAPAATHLVLPDGTGDFPTIQDALDAAVSGDEILLGDGTFSRGGNHNLRYHGKDVTVRSQSGTASACILELTTSYGPPAVVFEPGDGPGAVLRDVTITSTPVANALLTTSGSPTIDGVRFDGFPRSAIASTGGAPVVRNAVFTNGRLPTAWFDGGSPTLSDCLFEANALNSSSGVVLLTSAASGVVERCTFRDNVKVPVATGAMVDLVHAFAQVTDCDFLDNPGAAVRLDAYSAPGGVTVEDCRMESNDYGMLSWSRSDGVPPVITIRRTTASGGRFVGFDIHGPTHLTIEDVVLEGNHRGLLNTGSNALGWVVMRNTRVSGNVYEGMRTSAATVEIENCEFVGNGLRGAALYASGLAPRTATIRNCLFAGHTFRGLEIDRYDDALVEDATVANNGGLSSNSHGLYVGQSTAAVVRRTVVWDNCSPGGVEVKLEPTASISFECSDVPAGAIDGTGTVTFTDAIDADPLFCSPIDCSLLPSTAGVYSVRGNSPLLQQPCGLIGGLGAGCAIATSASSLESSTWARVKARYR